MGIDPAKPSFSRDARTVRIFADILYDSVQVLCITNNPIVGFFLPKLTLQLFSPIHEVRHHAFDGSNFYL
jgi:hypothetical protein